MLNHKITLVCLVTLLLAGCSTTQHQGTMLGSAQVNGTPPPANVPDAKEPDFNAETRFAAGQVAEAQNNPVAAIEQYQQALKLQPNHLGALYRMGIVYTQLKQYPRAITAWQRYIAASKDSATAYGDLGFCEQVSGDTTKAEAAYQAGIERDPKNVACRVNYGLMLARDGRIDDAIIQWRFVLTDAQIHYNLGGIYAAKGNKQQAYFEFNKALELDPNLSDAKARLSSLDQD